ncbi:MAG: hypothetical protein FIA95_07240, partial [Gemmatimonadetes bacterium]|nr:hypothetical protein [Gemmatimonadota bacterium]
MSTARLPLRPFLAVAGVLLLVWACVDGEAPLSPDGLPGAVARVPLQATIMAAPEDSAALPVNRIRAVAERIPDGQVLATTVVDVSPTAEEWAIDLEIPLTGQGVQVV